MTDNFHQPQGMRLAKYLSNAGIASRRRSEELITEGRITVNGLAVLTPVCIVVPGRDRICYEGREITQGQRQYVLLNKPVGYTCSASDPHADRLIYDLLPESMKHLYYVGRLDRDTEGLLILTNDGDLAQALTHPSREVPKKYIADCDGRLSASAIDAMLDGIEDEGELLRARSVRPLREYDDGLLLEVILTEGRKREVRRLCRAVGLRVRRLARTELANVKLGELASGDWRALTPEELDGLRSLAISPRRR
ncbi:MAG: rRNA pseudouridine synthase [Victivallales bacterium]|nr:rRNA pseudouridine synthase [Victivallales bacterium]